MSRCDLQNMVTEAAPIARLSDLYAIALAIFLTFITMNVIRI